MQVISYFICLLNLHWVGFLFNFHTLFFIDILFLWANNDILDQDIAHGVLKNLASAAGSVIFFLLVNFAGYTPKKLSRL